MQEKNNEITVPSQASYKNVHCHKYSLSDEKKI